jgi:uracil-DNA glycosylase
MFPLYHPASIIYNRVLKQVYEDDLRVLKDILDRGVLDASGEDRP